MHKNLTRLFLPLWLLALITVMLLGAPAPASAATGPAWAKTFPTFRNFAEDAALAQLGSGSLLVFGDRGDGVAETWVYASTDNTWSRRSPVNSPSARHGHLMANLENGKALLFGGTAAGVQLSDTWVFDLNANNWTQARPAQSPALRAGAALANLREGLVLLYGGGNAKGSNLETWIYTSRNNIWTNKAPSASPGVFDYHLLTGIQNSQALLIGGSVKAGDSSLNIWTYDLAKNAWIGISRNPNISPRHTLTYLGGPKVLLFGSMDASDSAQGETIIYDYVRQLWEAPSPTLSPLARSGNRVASVGTGLVVLYAGADSTTWHYDLKTNLWRMLSDAPTPRMEGHALTSLGEGRVLLYGNNSVAPDNFSWVFEAATNSWKSVTGPTSVLSYPGLAGLDGKAVLFGGWLVAEAANITAQSLSHDTHVFDAAANTWRKVSNSGPSARFHPAMAQLNATQALLFGGMAANGASHETWVFDVQAGAWTNKQPQVAPPMDPPYAMAQLRDGRVLLFGGTVNAILSNETWLYDLQANAWVKLSPKVSPAARAGHTLTALSSGSVLLFGGELSSGANSSETWQYSQSEDTWKLIDAASAPPVRAAAAVARLDNNRVLLYGGESASVEEARSTYIFSLIPANPLSATAGLDDSPLPENFVLQIALALAGVLILAGLAWRLRLDSLLRKLMRR